MNLKAWPVLAGLLLCGLASARAAGSLVRETSIAYNKSGTPIVVSVSTSAWTKINTSGSYVTDRSGFVATSVSSNTAHFSVYCATGAPALDIGVAPKLVQPGTSQWLPCGSNLNLYGVTRGASAQTIGLWEVGQ